MCLLRSLVSRTPLPSLQSVSFSTLLLSCAPPWPPPSSLLVSCWWLDPKPSPELSDTAGRVSLRSPGTCHSPCPLLPVWNASCSSRVKVHPAGPRPGGWERFCSTSSDNSCVFPSPASILPFLLSPQERLISVRPTHPSPASLINCSFSQQACLPQICPCWC